MLWQRLGNALGNHFRHRRGASVKDVEVTGVLRLESQSSALLFIKRKLTTGGSSCGLTAAGIKRTAYPD